MSNEQINIAIVGLGFGAEFIPIYQRHPNANMVAICQRTQSTLDEIGDKYGVEKRYNDYDALLADPDIDAVHINTAIPDHAAHTIAALKAGKHVACTVPMATSVEDCRQIVELCNETGLKYMKALIDQMVDMDCPSLIGPVYSAVGRADAVPAKEYRQQWKTVVKNLKELAAYAEKKGRIICLEPLNRFETDFINTCDQGLKMIKDVGSPALKLHLDTFHMNIEEKNQAKAIRKAGKALGHFHACGSDRGTPGGDEIDWPSITKALKGIRYKGDVVIESFTTDVKVIAKAAAIWRRIEPTQNEIAVKGVKFLKKTLK